jgi:Zn-dependent M28 family amino/carboxypeptidase
MVCLKLIEDNGSGSSVLLEIILQIFKNNINTKNKIRFAFWGAEEIGLLGARYYVRSLSKEERDKIVLYLNCKILTNSKLTCWDHQIL